MGSETRECVADGKGKEERGEGVALTNAGGRIHSQVLLIGGKENDGRVRSIRSTSCSPELRTMSLCGLGHVGSMDGVVRGSHVELASVLPQQHSLRHHLNRQHQCGLCL
jgi:hypothetical protein